MRFLIARANSFDPQHPDRDPLLRRIVTGLLGTLFSCALTWDVNAAAEATVGSDTVDSSQVGGIAKVPDAKDNVGPEPWNVHGQLTFVKQYHPSFTSPYQGVNSLAPNANGEQTTDLTLFLGIHLWRGGTLYINPEIDQGFGLSDTLGVAGFPSGAACKVGQSTPYFRLQRAFLRQRFDLGGESQTIAPGANELGGAQTADNVTVTAGKFSVTDVFDTNSYAHDPRGDFLNWAIIDSSPFDYAADAWGYTVGVAVEWTHSWWTLRGGFFDLSDVPNSKVLEPGFREFELVGELEERYNIRGHPGKLKVLGFFNYARMGSYGDAVAIAEATGSTPDTASVRHYASRAGVTVNVEQQVHQDLGVFVRAGINQGDKEAYEFTDVNKSISLGLSLKGSQWHRADDTWGLASAFNDISGAARTYFAAGGLGILIGDGQLTPPRLGTYRRDLLRVADRRAFRVDRGLSVHRESGVQPRPGSGVGFWPSPARRILGSRGANAALASRKSAGRRGGRSRIR